MPGTPHPIAIDPKTLSTEPIATGLFKEQFTVAPDQGPFPPTTNASCPRASSKIAVIDPPWQYPAWLVITME